MFVKYKLVNFELLDMIYSMKNNMFTLISTESVQSILIFNYSYILSYKQSNQS